MNPECYHFVPRSGDDVVCVDEKAQLATVVSVARRASNNHYPKDAFCAPSFFPYYYSRRVIEAPDGV